MINIVNVRLLNGALATLSLDGGMIAGLHQQMTMLLPSSRMLPLSEFIRLSQERSFIEQRRDNVVVDAGGELIVPGAIDCHVHSRDPGHPEKEDWHSLGIAALKGGVVGVVDMPNTLPPTLDRTAVLDKMERAKASGLDYRLLLGVNRENLSVIDELLADNQLPLCGLKIYYGNSTGNLQFADLDALAAKLAKIQDKIIVFHAEDQCRIDAQSKRLSSAGQYAKVKPSCAIHSEIRDSKAALLATQAILAWAGRWQKAVHIAHISTPAEVELIREAQRDGLRVSGEVCPHHLLFNINDYERLGGFLKVNPPVRSFEEMKLLQSFFARGAFDCFASDHAPHGREEKNRPYGECPAGLPAIEFFWPLFYYLARQCRVEVDTLGAMLTSNPARMFGFPKLGALSPGYRASFVWLDQRPRMLDQSGVSARCGWSPYVGLSLPVTVKATWQDGVCTYRE